ncbi:dual 3',5'-cyclic-AMP and -GMP phosphodiesterase 11A-like isoform X3 [Oratosquilla oratoria]|uniref:dual 3',5'-cyclic-AMP and -GMP phosphodiesterase 11A-like isoform X3 n=1 Tax=Oratosquilla oratoria TaxID=337810 RepID=UPI003F775E3E
MADSLSWNEVEDYLDAHSEQLCDYVVRKAELAVINKWLVAHGFLTVMHPSRRSSGSLTCSPCVSPSSPVERSRKPHRSLDSPFAIDDDGHRHRRTNSKKHLRHNFAKAKSRSVFRTCEPATVSVAAEARRSSFRSMRKYSSLPPSSNYILCLLIESKVRLPQYETSTIEFKKELKTADDKAFFLDIVKDIANDLDLTSLTRKTTENLSLLLNADGASLFIVENTAAGKKILVSKVFDIHSGTNIYPVTSSEDNAVEVPWGKGILGYVAETGKPVILECASEDPRYNDEVDRITGYHTDSLLCMPVFNAYNEVVAVAQVINRSCEDSGDGRFTKTDEKLFETYLQFVGIAITNAQLMDTSRAEYERNRSLLEVTHDIFEEQTSLENVILKTLQRSQRLLKCERAAVLLIEDVGKPKGNAGNGSSSTPNGSITCVQTVKFSRIFELNALAVVSVTNNGSTSGLVTGGKQLASSPHLMQLAEQVASSGDKLNIADSIEVEKGSSGNVRSLLAMPIRNSHFQIIGVAKIINKLSGQPFDENDEQLFEAFTIFCGLGINNTMMYQELEKANARQKVAIEVLSYHTAASDTDVDKLKNVQIPETVEWRLGSLTFDDFCLSGDQMAVAAVGMFKDLGLASRLRIDRETLLRWILTVKRNYRNVPYHNWRHAFNVAQVMFSLLVTCNMKETFSELECLAMFVGCLCHDLDHRGTNNAFQEKTGSALALLYGTQNTMEHHHFNHAVMILSSDSLNILRNLSSTEYSVVMNTLKQCILATDLTVYFQVRSRFVPLLTESDYDFEREEHREMLRSLMMTACDIAASTKPWDIQRRVAELVTSEFFDQGDLEKSKLKITPPALMDRDRKHELPLLQMRWIKNICLPLYEALSNVNPQMAPMRDGALQNMTHWAKLAATTHDPVSSASSNPARHNHMHHLHHRHHSLDQQPNNNNNTGGVSGEEEREAGDVVAPPHVEIYIDEAK